MTLDDTLTQTWTLMAPDARGRGKLVSLGTLDADGHPQMRTVMLRGADRATGWVEAYTDLRSAKVDELRRDPRASVLLWSDAAQVQLRLTGRAEILCGPGVAIRWESLRDDQRLAYGHQPPPGTPIAQSGAWHDAPNPANLAVLRLTCDRIEHVSLDPAGHRRALFSRADGWAGRWLSP